MAYLKNKRILIGQVEDAAGTPQTLTTTDYNCAIYDPKYEPMIEMDSGLKIATIDHGESIDIAGAKYGKITFTIKLTPGANKTTAPLWYKFARGCGLTGAVEGTTLGYSLSPLAAGDRVPLTLWIIDVDRGGSPVGIVHKIAGAMGKMKISAKGVGKPIELEFEFQGKHVAAADLTNGALTTLAVQASPDQNQPYIFSNFNQGYGMGANSLIMLSSFELDPGNTIEPELNPGDATSGQVNCFAITSRSPKMKVNPLKKTIAIDDVFTNISGNASSTMCLWNTTATIPLSIKIPNGQTIGAKEVVREGLLAWDKEVKCLRNGIDGTPVVAGMAVESPFEILFGAKS